MASVRLQGVRKVYDEGQRQVAVHGIDLDVADGEFVVLVGPSGCGKSTTLRMIAGLESLSGGTLWIGDRVVNDVPPKERDIAMVFQNYALYPHKTVYENLAFALVLRKLPKAEIAARVRQAAEVLGLESVLDRKPRHLSGGQRQRVAVGRAIVRQPLVFLFDEPLSNLDAKLRVQMRREISSLHRTLGATMIYVTHDQVEAMTMGDRIVVMDSGRVQQIDAPLALYERPANQFVAGFIGSPAMNFLKGHIERGDRAWFISNDGAVRLQLTPELASAAPTGPVVLGVRPERLSLARKSPGGGEILVKLDAVEPMGNEILLNGHAGEAAITARVPPQPVPEPGEEAHFAVELARLHLFDAETGAAIVHGGAAG
jgi:multiple sugar transport system ATP-binding protein